MTDDLDYVPPLYTREYYERLLRIQQGTSASQARELMGIALDKGYSPLDAFRHATLQWEHRNSPDPILAASSQLTPTHFTSVVQSSSPSSSSSSTTYHHSVEDDELQQALAISAAAAAAPAPPKETQHSPLKRADNIPVGLRNVGNTCYFNSMLQSYFNIPQLRRLALQFRAQPRPETSGPVPAVDTTSFMLALQNIFAHLYLGRFKYTDPSAVIAEVTSRSKGTFQLGRQEDVTEFDALFTELIEKASPETQQSFQTIFEGKRVTITEAKEQDGSKCTSRQSTTFQSLILPVVPPTFPIERLSLLDCFEQTMRGAIDDYETPKGHRTTAEQTTWFEELPPVLKLQLNRTAFSKGAATKVDTPVEIPDRLSLDRYSLAQRDLISAAQESTERVQSELGELAIRLNQLRHWSDPPGTSTSPSSSSASSSMPKQRVEEATGIDLVAAARALRSFVQSELRTSNPLFQKMGDAVGILDTLQKSIAEEVERVKNRIEELQGKLSDSFALLEKRFYRLQAVWIHEGVSGSGHYWSYLRTIEGGMNQWFKFNDATVTLATDQEVFAQAKGGVGSGRGSAYMLIYVLDKPDESLRNVDWASLVPDELIAEVCAANEKVIEPHFPPPATFTSSAATPTPASTPTSTPTSIWTPSASSPSTSLALTSLSSSASRIDRFYTFYLKLINDAQEGDVSLASDCRLTSFEAFARSVGRDDAMHWSAIITAYKDIYGTSMELDVGSSSYDEVKAKIGEDLIAGATNAALNGLLNDLQFQLEQYRNAFSYLVDGLKDLGEKRYKPALTLLVCAYQGDQRLHEALRHTDEINSYMGIACRGLLEQLSPFAYGFKDDFRILRKVGASLLYGQQRENLATALTAQFETLMATTDDEVQESIFAFISEISEPPPTQQPTYTEIFVHNAPRTRKPTADQAPHLLIELRNHMQLIDLQGHKVL